MTFIDPHLDYRKNGLYVNNIGGNGYNCKSDNVRLVTKSEKRQRAANGAVCFRT